MTQRIRVLLGIVVILVIANLGQAVALLQSRSGGTVVGGIVTGTNDLAAALNVDSSGNLNTIQPAGETVDVNFLTAAPSVNIATNSSGRTTIVAADTSRSFSIAAAGSTRVVTGGASSAIYVTGWGGTIATTTATGQTVQVVYGTGTTCLTGQVALTGAYSGGSDSSVATSHSVLPTVISEGGGLGAIFTVPANNDLCLVTTGVQAVAGRMSYAQF